LVSSLVSFFFLWVGRNVFSHIRGKRNEMRARLHFSSETKNRLLVGNMIVTCTTNVITIR